MLRFSKNRSMIAGKRIKKKIGGFADGKASIGKAAAGVHHRRSKLTFPKEMHRFPSRSYRSNVKRRTPCEQIRARTEHPHKNERVTVTDATEVSASDFRRYYILCHVRLR